MHSTDILLIGGDTAFMEEFGRAINAPHTLRHVPDEKIHQYAFNESRPGLILYRPNRLVTNTYDWCSYLKKCPETVEVPVVVLSDVSDPEDKLQAFSAGAIDYLVAPFIPLELQTRVLSILALQKARREVGYHYTALRAKAKELFLAKIVFLKGMAGLAETRDPETGDHLLRVQYYMKTLCRCLHRQKAAGYAALDAKQVADICRAAILHDIGKVGVRDHILLKEGPLTPEEFELMKMHTLYGERIIQSLRRGRGQGEDFFLKHAKDIAGGHHEYWNGGGYPRGLSGEAIPLSARLMAVADVYDSIISPRVYKPARSHAYALEFIMDNSGIRFDPAIVEAFFCQHKTFNSIANRFVAPPA